MMRAGKYYVGDLCYVMHEVWDEACGLFFQGRDDQGCNEGEFNLKDGRRFVSYNTAYGDGEYEDREGRKYSVDAGLIGCIRLEDIDLTDSSNFLDGGNVIDFPEDFDCYYDHGTIVIGHIRVDTDSDFNDLYEDEEEFED